MAASIVLLQQTRRHRELRRLHHTHQALLGRVRDLLRGPADPAGQSVHADQRGEREQ